MKARIINGIEHGGNWTEEYFQEGWTLTSVLPNPEFKKPEWNGTEWIDNSIIVVPQEISRMKFELQLYITTTVRDENNNIVQLGKTFQDIIDYIDSLQMSNFYKNLLKMRLLSRVTLERENEDLNNLAPGMGITSEQLDEIFIKGNTL